MNQDKYNQLVEECTKFRAVIEECKYNIGIEWFKDFPEGCSQDTSLILAKYLHAKGFGIPYVVSAEKESGSHMWIELDNYIIDITADQFEEVSEKVIVTKKSKFHNSFEDKEKPIPYNQLLTGSNFGDFDLFNAYAIICAHIKK